MAPFRMRQLAAVQYHGESGVTQTGIDAVVRIVQAGGWITKALLLTCRDRHCFYLELREHEDVVIRPSFASGYSGEGPAGLAIVLLLLRSHQIEVEEIEVPSGFMVRASESRLMATDMEVIDKNNAVRPKRLSDYTYGALEDRGGGMRILLSGSIRL